MTMTSGTRRRPSDSEADVETRVFERPPPFGLDRAMIMQIMRELEPRLRDRPGARPLTAARVTPSRVTPPPNIFLTPLITDPPPPWGRTVEASALEETGKRRRVIRQRSKLPWLLFAMSFGIAFGIHQDPVLRQQTATQIQTSATWVATGAQSSAIRLWRLVSRIHT